MNGTNKEIEKVYNSQVNEHRHAYMFYMLCEIYD